MKERNEKRTKCGIDAKRNRELTRHRTGGGWWRAESLVPFLAQ
jgi:hypothetical protein